MSFGSGTVRCAWQCFAVAIARFPAGNCRSPNQRQVVRDAVYEPGFVRVSPAQIDTAQIDATNGPPLRTGLWCINCFCCVSLWYRESMPSGARWAIRVTHHPSAGRKSLTPDLRGSIRVDGAFGPTSLYDQMGLHSDRRGIFIKPARNSTAITPNG
jgi:hypothetical protein